MINMDLDGLEKVHYFKKNWPEKSSSKKRPFFWLILFLIILIGLTAYFFIFRPQILEKERSVSLKIETPEEISVGQEFETKIFISNQENSDLVNLELLVNFPENFYFKSSLPQYSQILLEGCLINLSKIRKGEKQEVTIKGKIFGLPNEKKNFFATISFQLANFSSWFKKETSKEIVLKNYPFDLEIQSSGELINSEEGEFRLRIKNNTDNIVETKIVLSFPTDFNFSFLEPTPETEETENQQKIWLSSFDSREEKIINFKGSFSSPLAEEKKIKLAVGLIDEKKTFFLQQEKEFLVELTQPGLVLGLRINNSFLEEQSANFNDEISFILDYKNVSQEEILNLNLKLQFNHPEFLNLDKLSNSFWLWQSNDKKIEGNQWKIISEGENKYLSWDKSQIKNLEIINPTEEGEISFSLKIEPYEEIFKIKPSNPFSEFLAIANASLFRHQTIIFKSESNKIKLKINSRVKLETEARYFDEEGLKIGSGPMPPKVGETTSYLIFLQPTNTVNEIKNIKITTTLPEKITWLGEEKTSVGNLSFDNFSKKITWQIDSIPAYSGGPYSFLEASFKIGLTPNEEDRGKILTLLEKTFLEAEDALTGAKIYTEASALDTNLEFDDWAKEKGVVE